MLPDLLKAAVLLAWEIRFAVRISRASLLYDYLRTGIFFVFEHFFLIFFLVNVVPLLLTGKGSVAWYKYQKSKVKTPPTINFSCLIFISIDLRFA